VAPSAAASAGVSAKQAVAPVGAAQVQTDEVSARKRQGHVRHYRSGNRAALRTFGAIAGTIGGIIAANEARRAYRYYVRTTAMVTIRMPISRTATTAATATIDALERHQPCRWRRAAGGICLRPVMFNR